MVKCALKLDMCDHIRESRQVSEKIYYLICVVALEPQ